MTGGVRPLRIIATILFFPLFLVALASVYVYVEVNNTVGQDVVFNIPKGDNLSAITSRLERLEALPSDDAIFKAAGLMTRKEGPILAGQYQITADMNTLDLLALFRSGDVIQYQLTFPEGWTIAQWRQLLAEAPFLTVTTTDLSADELARALGIEGPLEGWFFPDTYNYVKGSSDLDILYRAHQQMNTVLTEEWQTRSGVEHLAGISDALVLASIIEKETGFPGDRAKIASVFHNRLLQGMKLQSDPTVIYGLGSSFDGDLKRSHLRSDTAYNTYTRRGLPPGAICSPGRAAIQAALTGSHHPYLYFVAMGDGKSYFSTSLDEHNQAVNKYQRGQP